MSGLPSVYSSHEDIPSGNELLGSKRFSLGDRLLNLRESLLNLVTGTRQDDVLNEIDDPGSLSKEAGIEITGELKRFLDMAKINSIDEGGLHVDYDSLRDSPPYLEYRQSYSPRLRYFNPAVLSSREEQLAFWINLYNTLIMDGVIAKKITHSVGSNPLRLLAFFRKTAYNVGGLRMSCDDIEHGILRGNRGHPMLPGPQFPTSDTRFAWTINPVDVRIHFALNCASRSCPPIQVYTPENIDAQLDLAARNFVNTDLRVDPEGHKVHLSAIFSWFKSDFGGQSGVIDFLIEHLPEDDRQTWLIEHRDTLSFKYKPYDWGLNSSELDFVK